MIPVTNGVYTVRNAVVADIKSVLSIDHTAFSTLKGEPLGVKHFESWLETYPQGFMVIADRGDRVVGYSMVMKKRKSNIACNFWIDTNNGYCDNHEPDGDILYGVSIAAEKHAYRASSLVFLAGRDLIVSDPKLKGLVTHSRLPGFREWKTLNAPDWTVDEALGAYIQSRMDHVQCIHEYHGGTVVRGIIDYLPEDVDSLGCAAQIVWQNPAKLAVKTVVRRNTVSNPGRKKISRLALAA